MGSRGTVKWFNQTKGFGFIEITSGPERGQDVFVHVADLDGNPPQEGDEVDFDVEEDRRSGKLRATRVRGGTGRNKGKGDDWGKGGGKRDDWGGGKGRGYEDDRRGGGYDRYDRGDDRGGFKGKGGYGDDKGKGKRSLPGDWDCAECGMMNFASRERCFKCGADKGRSQGGGKGRARCSRSRSRGRGEQRAW